MSAARAAGRLSRIEFGKGPGRGPFGGERMRIIWHGHACFEVQDRLTVVMDPHDGKSLGIKAPQAKADIVLVSHDHFDHNCTRVLKGDFTVVREPGRSEVKGV